MKNSQFLRLRNGYLRIRNKILNDNVRHFQAFIFRKLNGTLRFYLSIRSLIRRHGGYIRSIKKAVRLYRIDGIKEILQTLRMASAKSNHMGYQKRHPLLAAPINTPVGQILALRVLIVAELSIPQCTKYRVVQKQEMFQSMGIDCKVCSWTDTVAYMKALSTRSLIIFYRVPGFDNVMEMIAEAKRMNIPTIWEVDDLIFDRDLLKESRSLASVEEEVLQGILSGACLYRKAMLACDMGIASTSGLADAMKQAGMKEVFVIENALDIETMHCAEKLNSDPPKRDDGIMRIVYGSGTNTHDIDFEEAGDAVLYMLDRYENVRFRVIGPVRLPQEFSKYASQMEQIPFCDYQRYLSLLAECDINIAPLENSVFNDAKSNIKFIEASIVKIPSVCSPRSAFRQAVLHGGNGYLSESPQDFSAELERLILDPGLRKAVGESAYTYVMDHYSPDSILQRQIVPFIESHRVKRTRRRILSVNIYYTPRSFGGATIVAEQVNEILHNMDDFSIYVLTTLPVNTIPPYEVRRYEVKNGICVFGIGLPDEYHVETEFENPKMCEAFADVLAAVKPDLIHFHCIQGIGVTITDLCISAKVPYVVTLHDAWWLCGRQFMINVKGDYCDQEKIDTRECASCVDNPRLNIRRQARLRSVLNQAAILLAPSRFFADFYIKNGFSSEKVKVNKNGIRKPARARRYRKDGPLSFGYVGGNTEIKGVHLVKRAFMELNDPDIRLIVVDNMMNFGYRSYPFDFFGSFEYVQFVEAYNQDNMDNFFDLIDVLLFPTRCKESFGLTVREAITRNIWVIATDAGGVVEDIMPGKNGLIIPFHDKGDGLKKAILDTYAHFMKYEVGQEVCLETGQIRWFESQAEELAEMYKQVIDGNG